MPALGKVFPPNLLGWSDYWHLMVGMSPLVVDKAMSDFRCFTCSIAFVQLARQRKGLQQWFKTTHLPHQSGGHRGHDDRSSGCVIIHQREMSGNLGWLSLLTSIYDDVVA